MKPDRDRDREIEAERRSPLIQHSSHGSIVQQQQGWYMLVYALRQRLRKTCDLHLEAFVCALCCCSLGPGSGIGCRAGAGLPAPGPPAGLALLTLLTLICKRASRHFERATNCISRCRQATDTLISVQLSKQAPDHKRAMMQWLARADCTSVVVGWGMRRTRLGAARIWAHKQAAWGGTE